MNMKKTLMILAAAVVAMAFTSCKDTEDVYPAKIYLSGDGIQNNEVTLKAQQTVQINLAFFPKHAIKDNITYTSSNENVATVSESGLVRGIDTGTAIITVKCPMMPVRYCWLEHDYATATLKVHVTGSTLQLGEGEVSQGEADSRQQAW